MTRGRGHGVLACSGPVDTSSIPSRHVQDAPFDDVLRAAQRGSGWAFERLYHDNARHLEGFLRAQRDPDPADTTNEAFRRAFLHLSQFSGDHRAFRAWVFRIARNLRIDARRSEASRPQLVLVPDAERDGTDGGAELEALTRLDAEAARELVAQLPADQRDVILLRIMGDLSVAETAEALGKRPGSVRALQLRGLRGLRRRMTDVAPTEIPAGP